MNLRSLLAGVPLTGAAADLDTPVFKQLLRHTPADISKLKQLGLISLRSENQLVFFAVMPKFKGNAVRDEPKKLFAFVQHLFAGAAPAAFVHQPAQLGLFAHKSLPELFRPPAEAF